ncbi:MAG: YggS family pyridoxal phosphate-dependent enzyme [Deltaproteobacteria bacterium]|nr:YggS family pyridoxal phosphate-dependent enzyme [Deltaproteobacteria bacterium]
MGSISENLINVIERVNRAARKAGRDPAEITLVAVAKSVEPKNIKEAIAAGVSVFGENYVQEAQEHRSKIKDRSIKWHFIGSLQSNKAKAAVELFDFIQTVDSLKLALELNKRAKDQPKGPVDCLIQVNIAREKTKAGVDSDGALKLARAMSAMPNLRLRGLMAIPPFYDQPEMSRPYFVTLRRLAEHINKERIPGVSLKDLSMGMSSDFEIAIEEGATIIRVGAAIFGLRAQKPPAKKPAK